MKWYLKCLKQYAVFSGRARRKEYWMFVLFNAIFVFLLMFLDKMLGLNYYMQYGVLYTIYAVAVLIPGLAVNVRRLHDINRSGWWVLLSFVPIVGGIVLLIWACTEGTHGTNDYGEDPKTIAE